MRWGCIEISVRFVARSSILLMRPVLTLYVLTVSGKLYLPRPEVRTSMGFDPRIIKYRGKPIICRYDNIRAPNLRPQLRVQYLDMFLCGEYGPFQLTFDLYNIQDPKSSKPLAFANMDFEQVMKLIEELVKAVIVAYPQYTPGDIMRNIVSRVKPWHVRNISKIELGGLVEG